MLNLAFRLHGIQRRKHLGIVKLGHWWAVQQHEVEGINAHVLQRVIHIPAQCCGREVRITQRRLFAPNLSGVVHIRVLLDERPDRLFTFAILITIRGIEEVHAVFVGCFQRGVRIGAVKWCTPLPAKLPCAQGHFTDAEASFT